MTEDDQVYGEKCFHGDVSRVLGKERRGGGISTLQA